MEPKPKSIKIVGFEEELLASNRKLLHCLFKDKFGAGRYVWIPPWKGESGVERLFFKALEIEEWNDYDGVWSEELRQISREIPSLEEIRLPVKIQVGKITEIFVDKLLDNEYKVAIELLTESDETRVYKLQQYGRVSIGIGEVELSWDSLKEFLSARPEITMIQAGVEDIEDYRAVSATWSDWVKVGVRFWVWITAGLEKAEYQRIGKKIAADIRSYVRKRLSDYKSLERGFEELS